MIENRSALTVQGSKGRSSDNDAISRYIRIVKNMNKSTAYAYLRRLTSFKNFMSTAFDLHIDKLLEEIKCGNLDVFEILNEYSSHLSNTNISSITIKQRVVTVKNFFECNDIDISPKKFKLKVKLPRIIRKNKEALSKEDVTDILNACSDIRLKTYVMLLSSTGMRAQEAVSLHIKDFDLGSIPAKVSLRGEYTKTGVDRTIFLTNEFAQQLKLWLDYKYRTRRVTYHNQENTTSKHKTITEYRTPKRDDKDLVFAVYQNKGIPKPISLYQDLVRSFQKTLDRMGKGAREDGNERRRQITLHSFRRFVKTSISDLGYADYSEYFIGHSGSTYWRKKDSEKAEIFRKIEPYLTFLNIHQLERQGADIQSKVEELEDLNQSLRQRDKVKDDAIAQLSDQLVSLSTRLQEIERRQDIGAR